MELQLTQVFALRKKPVMQLKAVYAPEQVTKAGFAWLQREHLVMLRK